MLTQHLVNYFLHVLIKKICILLFSKSKTNNNSKKKMYEIITFIYEN